MASGLEDRILIDLLADMTVLVDPRTQRMFVLQDYATMVSEFQTDGGSGHRGPLPASKASIEALRKLDTTDLEPNQECPVCLVDMAGNEEEVAFREMPCKHRFHEDCIRKWLGMHGSCPLCRFKMPIEEEDTKMEEEEERPRMEIIELIISIMAAGGTMID